MIFGPYFQTYPAVINHGFPVVLFVSCACLGLAIWGNSAALWVLAMRILAPMMSSVDQVGYVHHYQFFFIQASSYQTQYPNAINIGPCLC